MFNQITWLVQDNLIQEDIFFEIKTAAESDSYFCLPMTIVPFADIQDFPLVDGIVIPYGSTSLIKAFDKSGFDKRGFFFDQPNLKTSKWIEKLGERILNYDAQIAPLKDVKIDRLSFIKPDDDLKDFSGTFLEPSELEDFYSKVSAGGYLFDENIPVVVAPVKNTGWEFRFFMVQDRVMAASSYKLKSTLNKTKRVPQEALDFAVEISRAWRPAEVFVVDLAETDNGWKVVEFNCFNASGFYNCNIDSIVSEVSSYVKGL